MVVACFISGEHRCLYVSIAFRCSCHEELSNNGDFCTATAHCIALHHTGTADLVPTRRLQQAVDGHLTVILGEPERLDYVRTREPHRLSSTRRTMSHRWIHGARRQHFATATAAQPPTPPHTVTPTHHDTLHQLIARRRRRNSGLECLRLRQQERQQLGRQSEEGRAIEHSNTE